MNVEQYIKQANWCSDKLNVNESQLIKEGLQPGQKADFKKTLTSVKKKMKDLNEKVKDLEKTYMKAVTDGENQDAEDFAAEFYVLETLDKDLDACF